MESKQISCGIPKLSPKYHWFLAQNLETDEHIFYTINKTPTYRLCRIPELLGRRIQACFHGWVILSSHPKIVTWSIWNPVTYKLISLPPLIHEQSDSHECCLSSPPDDPNSVFLLTTPDKPTIVFCRINVKRKRVKWVEMSYANQLKRINNVKGFLENPTCFNDKVYAMVISTDYKFIMQIDIVVKPKEVIINLLPFVEIPFLFFSLYRCPTYGGRCYIECYSFLKGYGTELFYGNIAYKDEAKNTVSDVELFKLDMTRMIWEEVEDLKDAIFFKEHTSESVFYRPAAVSELGGYIHIVGEMGKVIYSYNIKNRTISMSSMPRLVQESQVSVWVMLECRLEVDTEQEQEDKDGEIVVKPVRGDESNVEGESHLLNIPVPILEMIMELCIGVEYMKFRATCKDCHLAAPAIQWNNKTTLKRLEMYSLVSPWLMVWDKNQDIIIFTDPIYGDKYFIKIPQELSDVCTIYYSRFGWLLMYEFSGFLVFFNPFTRDIREVLPEAPNFDSLCFSAPPTSPDCMVVGCSPFDGCVYIHFVSGEPSWRRFVMSIDGHNPYFFNFPTFYGGDLYVLRDGGGVEVFRELGGNLSLECVVAKGPKSCCRDPTQYFLAYCNQPFFLVIMGEFGESIEVFRLDDFKKEWEKIDSIGNHMIYICDTTCLCIEAKTPEMGNKIYFARLSNVKNEKIVFYSLETRRYHTFNGKNIQETFGDDLFETKHHCYPHTWVEPNWC